MTEISDNQPASAREQFILHWGDMGGQWGVNRSVAQIHALLFLSSKPLHAEQISEELGIARSNVSNSLKELVSWRLIQRVPVAGDRREHFVAETDVWEMALRITKGRKEREIEPAIRAIDMCVQQAETEQDLDPVALQRMRDMQEFVTSADRWSEQMLKIPKSKLSMLLKMGDKVLSLLKVGGKTHD
ncbi:GbsR/MarR family transcriptional regulator [Roseibium sp. TrichSKD4]|uniref:GbsR/MarR family transcriptional regulator n=1 Tax=Roseibium sp. TrichSKD4 TaxID=744980 RepID=UPI000590EA6E|nr:MarR family transcriptional regulator [Roseibium sp. TrichSKD4]